MKILNFLFLIIFLSIFNAHGNVSHYSVDNIVKMEVNSTINPATLSYLKEAIKKTDKLSNPLLLIKLNTPGGLVSTTKEILTTIGSKKIPFVVWVTPEGASATSAGAIIASGAHQLLMSPGTNIGAATPITMSKELPEDARNKAINDLVALVQSLREARGKTGTAFKEMVEKASSFKAKEALEKGIVDGIVNSQSELISHLNGKEIVLNGKNRTLHLTSPHFEEVKMDLGQQFLDIFANPTLAYLLFIIGAALIYLELQAPGGFIAGAIGAVALILAGISFQVIPLNFGALALMGLSFILFVLEVYITSFGILTLAGIASLIVGSLFLYRTDDVYFELSRGIIFSSLSAIITFVGIITYFIIKNRRKDSTAYHDKTKQLANVIEISEQVGEDYFYEIKIGGEIWKAKSKDELEIGETVSVESKDTKNLIYQITKKSKE